MVRKTKLGRAELDALAPRVPWEEFVGPFTAAWGHPGNTHDALEPEHITVVASTRGGKTYLSLHLLVALCDAQRFRGYVIGTKPSDRTLSRSGLTMTDTWPPPYRATNPVIVWPKRKNPSEGYSRQRVVVRTMLDALWADHAREIVMFDERAYVENELALRHQSHLYDIQGNGVGIANLNATQRPVKIDRTAFSEVGWVFAGKLGEERDRETLSYIGGDSEMIYAINSALETREFLVIRRSTMELVRTRAPAPPGSRSAPST
ncbi:MAG: hypothetical protein ACRDRL_10105 [Sciscionella sp.]